MLCNCKIIDIIKESGREIFLAPENEDTVVVMSINRYRELIKKDNSFTNNIKEINPSASSGPTGEEYPDYVKKTIMPDIDR